MRETTIILQGEDIKLWTAMKAMQAVGVFNIKFGSATINFDGQGKVSNIEIKQNFRVQEISTS